MRYQVHHTTTLNHDRPIFEHHSELRLFPREEAYQHLEKFELATSPETELFSYVDAYGNRVHHFSIISGHTHLEIRASAVVENVLTNPFDFPLSTPAEEKEWAESQLKTQPWLYDYLVSHSDTVPDLSRITTSEKFPKCDPQKNRIESVQEAMLWVKKRLRYIPGVTEVHHPLLQVLKQGAGVCQDFAHLLIAIARFWGFPARYVMGYQVLNSSEGTPATHAWAEVYLPVIGWCGFDATTGLLVDQAYLPVAVGRDSRDAAPHKGSYKGADLGQAPEVSLQIIPQQ